MDLGEILVVGVGLNITGRFVDRQVAVVQELVYSPTSEQTSGNGPCDDLRPICGFDGMDWLERYPVAD